MTLSRPKSSQYSSNFALRKLFAFRNGCKISELVIHQIFSLPRDWSKRVTRPNIPQLKYSTNCKPARVAKKYLKDNKHKPPFGIEIYWHNCPWTLSVPQSSVFLELRFRKSVRFSEQIMSADKYPNIFFAPNGGYCLYIFAPIKGYCFDVECIGISGI